MTSQYYIKKKKKKKMLYKKKRKRKLTFEVKTDFHLTSQSSIYGSNNIL